MAIQHNWADICSSIVIQDGFVKMRFSTVETFQPKVKEGETPIDPGARISNSEVLVMPIVGFIQMLGTLDKARDNPVIKNVLERMENQRAEHGNAEEIEQVIAEEKVA